MTISGTASAYPADLPVPQAAGIQSAERRVLSPGDGLFEARTGQTDRLEFQDVTFPPFTYAEAVTFQAWWKDDLRKGGLWFDAVWPLPRGWVSAIRRFVEPPAWEFIPKGFWRVTAQFELRGTGELPLDPNPPSSWNPDDKIALVPPAPMELTENTRLATRETNSDSYEAGVRGKLSHSGSGKWYFELEMVEVGVGSSAQIQFGLLDGTMKNESFYPLNDESNPTNTSEFVVCSGRFDGIVFSSQPTFNASPGTFGTKPVDGDVYGFAWDVGTSVQIYRNGVLGVTAALSTVAALFPYFNAGSTNASGPDPTGTGESVRIRTGKRQFAYYPPTGFLPWG